MDNSDRIPGLKYPTNIPKSVPIEVHQIIRNIYDNLIFDLKRITNLESFIGTNGQALQNLIKQSVVQAVTNSTTNITNAGIVAHVSTHAVRLVTYSSATDPTGSLFFETDRGAIYYITDAFGVPRWQFAAGSMVGPLNTRPTDLGAADEGFMFTATEDHLHSEYVWSGTGWITVGGQFGPPGLDGQDGEDGAMGPPGTPGPPGSIGLTGSMGPPGDDGPDGADGPPGPPGPAGATGPAGPAGASVQSSPGVDGEDGLDGWPGPMGAVGPSGPAGPQGIPGIGIDGIDGEEGMPIPGPQGPIGLTGATGPAGPAGIYGMDGMDGEEGMAMPGQIGLTGAQGPIGPPVFLEAEAGEEGPIGAPGPPYNDTQAPNINTGVYAPDTFVIATGRFGFQVNRLQLTGTQRATIRGTGRLRIG